MRARRRLPDNPFQRRRAAAVQAAVEESVATAVEASWRRLLAEAPAAVRIEDGKVHVFRPLTP